MTCERLPFTRPSICRRSSPIGPVPTSPCCSSNRRLKQSKQPYSRHLRRRLSPAAHSASPASHSTECPAPVPTREAVAALRDFPGMVAAVNTHRAAARGRRRRAAARARRPPMPARSRSGRPAGWPGRNRRDQLVDRAKRRGGLRRSDRRHAVDALQGLDFADRSGMGLGYVIGGDLAHCVASH